jgi:hypothetical protein
MVARPDIEHIVRRSTVPWRTADDHLTECGKAVADYPSITYDEYLRKRQAYGQRRTALTTCMTCDDVSTRWKDWATDPLDAIRREVLGMRRNEDSFRKELWAIAALIDTHRDEFDGYLKGLDQTTDLGARRRAKRTNAHPH